MLKACRNRIKDTPWEVLRIISLALREAVATSWHDWDMIGDNCWVVNDPYFLQGWNKYVKLSSFFFQDHYLQNLPNSLFLYRCLRLFLNFIAKHQNKIPSSSNLILPTTKITPWWWAFCAWSMILSWRTSSLNPRRWMPSFRKSKRGVASKRRREVNGTTHKTRPHKKSYFFPVLLGKNIGDSCFKMRGFKPLILRYIRQIQGN